MTYSAKIAIVRRFREYPDRIVGKPAHGRAEKSPRNLTPYPAVKQESAVCAILDTRDSPQNILDHCSLSPDLNVVSLRPIAIVPATPSTLDGLCGPGQRNGVGSSFELGKDARPPSTVYVWLVVPIYRRNSRERSSSCSRGWSFGRRGASAFSIFLRVRQKAKPSPAKASRTGLVLRFCAHLLRSSSAYVPSARQAGPHAHTL